MTDFQDSYLGRLRQVIGTRMVLMPGASVLCERGDGRILLIKRGDFGSWALPAGSAEGRSVD